MIRMMLISTAALLAGIGAIQAAELSIDVAGVRDAKGKVMVALHEQAGGVKFPDTTGAIAAQWRKAEPGTMRFVFPGLTPGQYAVAVYHDENSNGEMDTNMLGMPSEGYGFSNEAEGSMGPPSFADAAVNLADGAVETKT